MCSSDLAAQPRKGRAAPAQTASGRPLLPGCLPAAQTRKRGPAAAPASQLRRPGTRLETPFAHTRAGVAPRPQPHRPRGLRARCQSHYSAAPPDPSPPFGAPVPPPRAPAQARRLRRARGRCRPSSGRRRVETDAAVPPGPRLPRAPAPVHGTTCWDGSPGGGSSKSIMPSWGRRLEAPRRLPCSGCRGLVRTRRRRRRLFGDRNSTRLNSSHRIASRMPSSA